MQWGVAEANGVHDLMGGITAQTYGKKCVVNVGISGARSSPGCEPTTRGSSASSLDQGCSLHHSGHLTL
jgi:hypothetical protein